MARQPRLDIAGEVFHVINRSNARWQIFKKPKDYRLVLDSLVETLEKFPLEIFGFCIMPNHWHFVVRAQKNGDIGKFFGKFTQKVTQRWHNAHHTVGSGHLFQGRFKSFLVQQDSYFLQLMKYVEANALRAKLVKRAQDWQWGSLYLRYKNSKLEKNLLTPWPVSIPRDYLRQVNLLISAPTLVDIRRSVNRSRPLGEDNWVQNKVMRYDLDYTIRERGRPKNYE